MIDANDEIRWEASGPMRDRLARRRAQPGSFTVVGSTPPSGSRRLMRVGRRRYEFLKGGVTLTNATSSTTSRPARRKAQALFRKGKRKVEVSVNAMYSSDVTLMTAAEGTTDQVILAQCGQTRGQHRRLYTPDRRVRGAGRSGRRRDDGTGFQRRC
jgi:hypothetical protein